MMKMLLDTSPLIRGALQPFISEWPEGLQLKILKLISTLDNSILVYFSLERERPRHLSPKGALK